MLSEQAAHVLDGLRALGFGTGLPPAAAPLAEASSAVVCRTQDDPRSPASAEIVCIVDRAFHPARVYGLDGARLARVARSCASMAGRRLGIFARRLRITVVEVGAPPVSPADRKRLEELVWGPSGATLVEVLHVSSEGVVWALRSDADAAPLAPTIAALARGELVPAAPAARSVPQRAHAFARSLRQGPYATFGLLALLAVAFLVEAIAARSLDPDPDTLYALGGMSADAVRTHGEWWRLLSASLLHGDLAHLLLNGLALLFGGAIVEMLAGRRWLLVAYVLSAVGGSLAGMRLNSPDIVSVGASGAIMGLLGAGSVLAFRIPDPRERAHLLGQLACFLVPLLVPLAMTAHGGPIDYAAHAGGALAGALVGGALLLAARAGGREARERPAPRAAAVLAAAAVILYAASATAAARRFGMLAPMARLRADEILVKDDAIPTDSAKRTQLVETWGKGHDRDPRVRYFRALARFEEGDLEAAEREARAGLGEEQVLAKFFPNRDLETHLRGLLCLTLVQQGRRAEALDAARPVCTAGTGGSVPEVLRELHVCGS